MHSHKIGIVKIGIVWMVIMLGLIQVGARAQEAVWSVAGKQVLRLHATAGDKTPQKRVEALDERVNEILSRNGTLRAQDIVVKHEKGEVFITVRDYTLVTILPDDAQANHTTRDKLAQVWLSNLRNTLPLLAPRVNEHGA